MGWTTRAQQDNPRYVCDGWYNSFVRVPNEHRESQEEDVTFLCRFPKSQDFEKAQAAQLFSLGFPLEIKKAWYSIKILCNMRLPYTNLRAAHVRQLDVETGLLAILTNRGERQ